MNRNKSFRIIPRLDIKGSKLVKGINFEGLRVIGDPYKFALNYYNQNADEILLIDCVASLYNRNNISDIIKQITKDNFIPIAVGGGIKDEENARDLFEAGADRISVNTGLVKNPELISTLSSIHGSQALIGNVEISYYKNNPVLFTDNGRERTGLDAKEWLFELCEKGCGEILLSFVNTDGTGKGLLIDKINELSESINIPFLVHGGIGNINHINDIKNYSNADGVCISSIIHYAEILNMDKEDKNNNSINSNYNKIGNTDFIFDEARVEKIINNFDLLKLTNIQTFFKKDNKNILRNEREKNIISKIKKSNKKLSIIHCNNANLSSLVNFCSKFGFSVNTDINLIKKSDFYIFSGNGNFHHNMNFLNKFKLVDYIKSRFLESFPMVGICSGMQIFFESSEESKHQKGLSLIKGKYDLLPKSNEAKIPNIGWRQIFTKKNNLAFNFENRLFYFMHSYFPSDLETEDIVAFSSYFNINIPSLVYNKNFIGFQFHPEKSSTDGFEVFDYALQKLNF